MQACTKKTLTTKSNYQKTPLFYRMTQEEKEESNYELKQSRSIIKTNIKNKDVNQKYAEKKKTEDQAYLNELNSQSKVKKVKKEATPFSFYNTSNIKD